MPGKNGVRRSQQEGLRSASIGGGRGVLGGVWGKAASRAGKPPEGGLQKSRGRGPLCQDSQRGPCRRRPAGHLLTERPPDPLRQGPLGKEGAAVGLQRTGERGCSGVVPCRGFPWDRAGVDSWREQVPGEGPGEPCRAWGAGREGCFGAPCYSKSLVFLPSSVPD